MKPSSSPEYRILARLDELPAVESQNILMSTPTREIAMSILRLDSSLRETVLARISRPKAAAVREELARLSRTRVEERQTRLMAENLLARLYGGGGGRDISSYLRPRRPGK